MPMTYDLNLREYWRTIRKRKAIVIFTIVMMTLFSFVFSILGRPTPIYKASASVKVEKTGSATGLYIQSISWSTTNYMETQMAMIKSYFIMELVAKKIGLIPLSYRDPRIYIIARLVGYLTGDAHLYHKIRPTGKSYTEIQVYALREEIENIGYSWGIIIKKPENVFNCAYCGEYTLPPR